MQPTLDVRRHGDGSTDFDFHRRRATRRRRLARRMRFKQYLAVGSRMVSASVTAIAGSMTVRSGPRGSLRLLARAGAAATVLMAVAGFHAWAQGEHGHHITVLAHELKWAPGHVSLPPGAQVVLLEGNPANAEPLTMRLKFPAGYKLAPHTHPAIEHVTVLSGTFHMGAGDKFDESKGKRLPVGSFAVMPAGAPHFAWASEETVIQLHSVGPWGVTYLNPADDPRNK